VPEREGPAASVARSDDGGEGADALDMVAIQRGGAGQSPQASASFWGTHHGALQLVRDLACSAFASKAAPVLAAFTALK